MKRSGHPCPGDTKGLAAAAAHLCQTGNFSACSNTGQHIFPIAKAIQSIYLIIDLLLRATLTSEASVCARDSETYVSPQHFTPGLVHLLVHPQLLALQYPVVWVCTASLCTHQKSDIKMFLVKPLLWGWPQLLLCEIKGMPKAS